MATYNQSQMTLPSGDVVKFIDNTSGYVKTYLQEIGGTVDEAAILAAYNNGDLIIGYDDYNCKYQLTELEQTSEGLKISFSIALSSEKYDDNGWLWYIPIVGVCTYQSSTGSWDDYYGYAPHLEVRNPANITGNNSSPGHNIGEYAFTDHEHALTTGYGDKVNPYLAKPANWVLAGSLTPLKSYNDYTSSENIHFITASGITLAAGSYVFSARVHAEPGGTRSGNVQISYGGTDYPGNVVSQNTSSNPLDGVSSVLFTLPSSTKVYLKVISSSSQGYSTVPIEWSSISLNNVAPGFRPLESVDLPSIGNITNTGDITTNVAIASGDRLVINDESESKLNNSSITFGTSTNQFLANNGTWQTPAGSVEDVKVNGTSVVDSENVANITVTNLSITANATNRTLFIDTNLVDGDAVNY